LVTFDGVPLEPGRAEELYEDELLCAGCGEAVQSWVPVNDKNKALFMRWMHECHRKNLIGPSPGGAANQLRVSRARIYSLVAEGVLERTDCEVEGYQATFISQRSINARKQQLEAMRAAGKDPEAGGRPWHKEGE